MDRLLPTRAARFPGAGAVRRHPGPARRRAAYDQQPGRLSAGGDRGWYGRARRLRAGLSGRDPAQVCPRVSQLIISRLAQGAVTLLVVTVVIFALSRATG